jgi:ElaB/YqjD/DUF883 family membrane-anchored ribosome-binding protein
VPVIELPHRRAFSPRLNEAAERLGYLVGRIEVELRQMPRRATELRDRLNRARAQAGENASTAASEWKLSAQQNAEQARSRAQFLANQYPIETIAGTAGAAFVAGFVLRIWRSNHARRK